MKILITGALGYIGNQILKKVANKHEIYACDNSSEAIETYYPIWKDKVHLVPEDVCVVDSCGVDLVIHLAAEVGYVSCDKKPELAQKTNIEGTKRIASFELPTLFFSTSSVYGLVPNSSYVCDENFPCNPAAVCCTLIQESTLKRNQIRRTIKATRGQMAELARLGC